MGRAGTAADEDRARLASELANVTYDTLLSDGVIYGTPEEVAEQLQSLIEEIDLSGVVLEMNAGGLMPIGQILKSLRLFGDAMAPKLLCNLISCKCLYGLWSSRTEIREISKKR